MGGVYHTFQGRHIPDDVTDDGPERNTVPDILVKSIPKNHPGLRSLGQEEWAWEAGLEVK